MTRTAIDKRDSSPPPRVERGLLITSPRELDAVIRRIPEGRVVTVGAIRTSIAQSHKADDADGAATRACLRIVADAAEEERATGRGGRIAPYWRVVDDDGGMLAELPGGVEVQARALTAEGVTVLHVGKLPRVTTVEHFAWRPPPLGKAAAKKPPVTPRKRAR
jgi:alkylated DNA nucleotide flippase Atl1